MCIIKKGKDFKCFHHTHHRIILLLFEDVFDKDSYCVPKVIVTPVNGQLYHIGRGLGNLEDLAVDDGDAGGFFRAPGQKFGDGVVIEKNLQIQTIGVFQELDDRDSDNTVFVTFEANVITCNDNLFE